MRMVFLAALAVTLLGTATGARAANEWGIEGEEKARFTARVVDILCELTGDCPQECGAGKRQLGLLKEDGTLVLPLKNQTFFSGAADELIDFCGKPVVADGLMITNRGVTFFALQFVREAPDGKWRRADRFLRKWAARNGLATDDPKVKRWFENDPRVQDIIARQGKLGLGREADQKYMDSQ